MSVGRAIRGYLNEGEEPFLLKRFNASEVTSGSHVKVEFGKIRPKDSIGRFAHLVGVFFVLALRLDIVAANLTAAITGRRHNSMLTNVRFQFGGWEAIRAIADARRLRDDSFIREGALLAPDARAVPDTNATDLSQMWGLLYRFGPSNASRVAGRKMDFGIPALLLDHRENPEDVMEFDIAANFAGNPAGVADYTFTQFDVYAIIRWENSPILDALWTLREITDARTQFVIEQEGSPDARTHYACIRHHEEETGGEDLSDYSAMTIYHGADLYGGVSGLSAAEVAAFASLKYRTHAGYQTAVALEGAMVDLLTKIDVLTAKLNADAGVTDTDYATNFLANLQAPRALELGTSGVSPNIGFLPVMCSPPDASRGEMGQAPISLDFTRATHTTTRVLRRQVMGTTPEVRAVMADRYGLDPVTLKRRVMVAKPMRNVGVNMLPQAYGPGAKKGK